MVAPASWRHLLCFWQNLLPVSCTKLSIPCWPQPGSFQMYKQNNHKISLVKLVPTVLTHSSQTVHQGTLGCHSQITGAQKDILNLELLSICWLPRELQAHGGSVLSLDSTTFLWLCHLWDEFLEVAGKVNESHCGTWNEGGSVNLIRKSDKFYSINKHTDSSSYCSY